MKICGVLDSNRSREELRALIEKMNLEVNRESFLKSTSFVTENIGVSHICSEVISRDKQPVWNENKTQFIVMAGKIFDYEKPKMELIKKGHIFTYSCSDAEFILHAMEEWGNQIISNLNGSFVFALYNFETMNLTIVNDRCGMKPLYFFNNGPHFVFASEVKAVIQDIKIKRQINWEAWRDFFSYGFMLGSKTPFENILALPPATILTINHSGNVSSTQYWNYTQIKVDHESSEQYFVAKGAQLLKQAIQRQTSHFNDCIVLLSGGYDSRFIAGAIKEYTDLSFKTYTTRPSHFLDSERSIFGQLKHHLDPIIAKEVARALKVKNIYVQRPCDLYKYLAEKVFLLDGMCLEHLWMLPVVKHLKGDKVNFDGIAGDVLLRGSSLITKDSAADVDDGEGLAVALDARLKEFLGYPTETIVSIFKDSVQQKIRFKIDSLKEEINKIGNHENLVTIFHMMNRTKNSISLMPNNLIGTRTVCLFPFLDKDLVEFALTIPPVIKTDKKIYVSILKKLFPQLMTIPATTYLSFYSIKHWGKKYLLIFPLSIIKHLITSKSQSFKVDAQYLLNVLKSMPVPDYIDVDKAEVMTNEYLSNGKNPLSFLVPLVEFCIWYQLFILEERNICLS